MQIVGGSPASEQIKQAFEVTALALGSVLFAGAAANFVQQVLRPAVNIIALQQTAIGAHV